MEGGIKGFEPTRDSGLFGMTSAMRTMVAALLVIAALTTTCLTAVAQQGGDEAAGGSFLTPFPENDIYKLQVLGDWWADGLMNGLVEAVGSDQRVQIARQRHTLNGINRNEFEDDIAGLEEVLAKQKPHIAIVMVGQADRTSLRIPGQSRRAQVGAEEWRAEYARRLDRLIRALKKHNVSVYWVGLPTLRRGDAHEDAQLMNEIIRERASLNGVRYVDAFGGFASDSGGYDNYGPDITGKIRVLREGDGVGFTSVGYRKLAHFVERELKRDLQAAQAERSIPLAGSDAEQQKLNPARAQAAAATQAAAQPSPGATKQPQPGPGMQAPWQATISGAKAGAAAIAPVASPTGMSGFGDQKADHGKIALKLAGAGGREETITLDILRPALASTVIAAVTRRETADKPSQMGDSIGDDLPNGLTVMSSITPSSENAGNRRRLAASQTPYFRALVKGERLVPKPGRADDHAWPRPEPEPAAVAPPAAAAAQPQAGQPTPTMRKGRAPRG